jgi:hypothetical protein
MNKGKCVNLKNKNMSFKKVLQMTLLAMLIMIALPAASSNTDPVFTTTNGNEKTSDSRAGQLLQRLEEIKGMNKSDLTRLERKALRKEVIGIKKESKAISGGIYLSVGAIIIIVLLLILLL